MAELNNLNSAGTAEIIRNETSAAFTVKNEGTGPDIHVDKLSVTSVASIYAMSLGDITLSVVDGETLSITSTASITGVLDVTGAVTARAGITNTGEVKTHSIAVSSIASIAQAQIANLVLSVVDGDTLALTSGASIKGFVDIRGGENVIGGLAGDTFALTSTAS